MSLDQGSCWAELCRLARGSSQEKEWGQEAGGWGAKLLSTYPCMGWFHAAGHPGLRCGVLAEPPRTSAGLTGRKVSLARSEWLTVRTAYFTVEWTQLMGTAAISYGSWGTQDPHHPLSTLQGHPAYLMPPRPGLGHLCCFREANHAPCPSRERLLPKTPLEVCPPCPVSFSLPCGPHSSLLVPRGSSRARKGGFLCSIPCKSGLGWALPAGLPVCVLC